MKPNLGIVIQIATLLAGLAVTWGALNAKVDAIEKNQVDAVLLEKRLGEIQGELRELRVLIERDQASSRRRR